MLRKAVWIHYLIVGGLLTGCAGGPRQHVSLGWPPPPQDPKVVYLETVYGTENYERGFWHSIQDFFLGRPKPMAIGKPYGLCQGPDGRLYIADTSRKGIMVLDPSSGRAELITSLGAYGQLGEPVYVIVGPDGDLYVSDTQLARVVVFDRNHRFKRFIGAEGELEAPVGMAFDPRRERLFVVDTRRHRVNVYDPQGRLIDSIGRRGDDRGQFHFPLTAAVSLSGDTLYVVDSFHFAVQAFDREGNYLFSFGPTAVGMGTMARPRDIALDSDGNIYVTDAVRNNVQVYDHAGNLLLRFGSQGVAQGQFRLPAGIFIGADNRIYVADSVNGRLQIFRYMAQN